MANRNDWNSGLEIWLSIFVGSLVLPLEDLLELDRKLRGLFCIEMNSSTVEPAARHSNGWTEGLVHWRSFHSLEKMH